MLSQRASQEQLELVPLLRVDPRCSQDMDTNKGMGQESRYEDEKSGIDEAQVYQASSSSPPSNKDFVVTEEERRLVRRLDMRIMPIACILYLFACKSNALSVAVNRFNATR